MKEGETNIISLVLELYTEIVDCSSRMASCIMYNFYYVKFEKKCFIVASLMSLPFVLFQPNLVLFV